MTSGIGPPQIYPEYCHALSPTIGKWCPLRTVDVHRLQRLGLYVDGVEIYHYNNHPVKWVRLTGVIVAMDRYPERVIYTLDDSSGVCVQCVCPAPEEATPAVMLPTQFLPGTSRPTGGTASSKSVKSKPEAPSSPSVLSPRVPWDEVDVGVVVKIKGRVGRYRDEMKIDIVKVEVLRSTQQEVSCWDEALAFKRDVLRVLWVVSCEDEERCRKKALRRSKGRVDKSGKKMGPRNGKQRVEVLSRRSRDEPDGRLKEREKEREKQKRESAGPRKQQEEGNGLDAKNKVNYPSLALRRIVAGKYDALGI